MEDLWWKCWKIVGGNFGGLFFGRSFSTAVGLLVQYFYQIFLYLSDVFDVYASDDLDLVEMELV